MISVVSAFCWSVVLGMLSSLLMKMPFLQQYHQMLGKALLLISLLLFVLAVFAILYRLLRRSKMVTGE